MEGLLAILLLLLAGAFVLEVFMLQKLHREQETYEAMNDNLIEVFTEVKRVTNVNSSALRGTQEAVVKHDKLLELLSTIVDLHSEVLKIKGSVREALEVEVDTDVEDVVE